MPAEILSKVPQQALEILDTLKTHGHEAVLVGGCVRDLLYGRAVNDYDIATSAHPLEVMEIFTGAIPTGIAHGTVTVVKDGRPYEVTTYRVDLGYSDGRHPDAIRYSENLKEDLMRRDFTVNAMALTSSGQLIDPFGGMADLEHRTIRAVGDPKARFTEDGLRILRAIRFAAQLGFDIESATHRSMASCAEKLGMVSTERVGQELMKVAQSDWLRVLPDLVKGRYLEAIPGPVRDLTASLKTLLESVQDLFPESLLASRSESWSRIPWSTHEASLDEASHRAAAVAALWVFRYPQGKSGVRALFRALAWSKQFSSYILAILDWLCALDIQWSQIDWRRALFSGKSEALWTACLVKEWWGAELGLAQRYLAESAAMPIHRLQDLGITGRTLEIAGWRGAAIGSTLRALADAVLTGAVSNRPDALLDYAQRACKSEASTEEGKSLKTE